MVLSLLKKVFGTENDRLIKKYRKTVEKINAAEASVTELSDEKLRDRTNWLKERLNNGETLDDILVDAFATVREAAKRTLGQRHYDVQLIGGIILHNGMITEMKTGEGKTLVTTLPAYLNALSGKGVHVVTVNDYLAKRDAAWMGEVYKFLGLSVGCIYGDLSDEERQESYAADITYGTNNEFGFDYLRDNMKFRLEDMVMRPFNFAIIDEADSILIDEARTPLIISGPSEGSSDLYNAVDALIPELTKEDYELDEKQRNATFTEAGTEKLEKLLTESGLIEGTNLYDLQNTAVVMHLNQALKAHTLFERDKDYIVKDNEVVIIDEFTGRMLSGRRYSEGLHQAIEAKEGVEIQKENQTLASITFQNYFRLYPKISGMTGTALTEEAELMDIYNLRVVDVPTNVPVIRKDHDDEVYRTAREKYDAILKLIKECQDKGQPVLVGTTSIEKSEYISSLLKKANIKHSVLNARYHEKEAHIIAEAGCPGSVTIATNMAGRGTDIKLGGNLEMRLEIELAKAKSEKQKAEIEEKIKKEIERDSVVVREAGGLYVVATERHESRRIDNQLRGRSGRQGDPGASKFFLSLEDDLMRIFGSERLDNMLQKLGLEEGEAITHPWVSKALQKAQQRVEARNYDIRKHLLKYDDVMNDQRKVIYDHRREFMTDKESVTPLIEEIYHDVVQEVVMAHIPENALPDQWDTEGLKTETLRLTGHELPVDEWAKEEGIADDEIETRILKKVQETIEEKRKKYGTETIEQVQRSILLNMLDKAWKDHLLVLDHLRQGINLRAYGQRDPLNEYKQEAFSLFQTMLVNFKEQVLELLCRFEIGEGVENLFPEDDQEMIAEHKEFQESEEDPFATSPEEAKQLPRQVRQSTSINPNDPNTWGRVARNAVCPCGSGKKFKQCHGKI